MGSIKEQVEAVLQLLFWRRVEDMRMSLEERRQQYWIVYQSLFQTPRIYIKDVASVLGADPAVTSRRMREAFEAGYIVGPQIRKRSYSNMKEYVYFVNCENPRKLYLKYNEDFNVVYHAVMIGSPNLWIVSREPFDVEGDVILEGFRSDYHIPFAQNCSWETALKVMQEKVNAFNPETYAPNEIINTHLNEPINWDAKDETLYRAFKYNLRKKLSPIMREHHISGEKLYTWLEKIPKCCTTATYYFPETASAYDPYFFMFETDYEDFIVDLFSELPTSSFFFKVSNRLFLVAYLKRQFLRYAGVNATDFSKMRVNLLLMDLMERGITKSEVHTIVEYYTGKSI